MKEVDHALAHSLGMKHSEDGSLDLAPMEQVEILQEEPISAYQFLQEQLVFWNNMGIKLMAMKNDIAQLEEEIESILNFIEDTTYNAVQGYRMYKLLRDKRAERKRILKEVICLEALQEQINGKEMAGVFQSSLDNASRKIKEASKITVVKELQMEEHETSRPAEFMCCPAN